MSDPCGSAGTGGALHGKHETVQKLGGYAKIRRSGPGAQSELVFIAHQRTSIAVRTSDPPRSADRQSNHSV
jgi:hypothetical protein